MISIPLCPSITETVPVCVLLNMMSQTNHLTNTSVDRIDLMYNFNVVRIALNREFTNRFNDKPHINTLNSHND